MLLFLIFNVFSVYVASQTLKMSFITGIHNETPFSFIYNALYGILIVLGLHQLNNIKIAEQKILYTSCCHISAIAFALAGLASNNLKHFTLTRGFWKRLSVEGKIGVSSVAIVLFIMVFLQGRLAYRKKRCCKQFLPLILLGTTWCILWSMIIDENVSFNIHVHHALFAGLFSCWFNDFTSKIDIIMHAILIGIVIEGIDFYGIVELYLFMIENTSPITVAGFVYVWLFAIVGLLYTIIKKKKKISEITVEIVPVA
tara:strand:- start:1884 stop:2651 length:768 start_codon:yes stop_codon:yes gene_type:complete